MEMKYHLNYITNKIWSTIFCNIIKYCYWPGTIQAQENYKPDPELLIHTIVS